MTEDQIKELALECTGQMLNELYQNGVTDFDCLMPHIPTHVKSQLLCSLVDDPETLANLFLVLKYRLVDLGDKIQRTDGIKPVIDIEKAAA